MSINKTTKSKLKFLDEQNFFLKQHEFSSGNPVGTVLNTGEQKSACLQGKRSCSPIFSDDQTWIRKIRRGKYL